LRFGCRSVADRHRAKTFSVKCEMDSLFLKLLYVLFFVTNLKRSG
jgi:hypothetical protein